MTHWRDSPNPSLYHAELAAYSFTLQGHEGNIYICVYVDSSLQKDSQFYSILNNLKQRMDAIGVSVKIYNEEVVIYKRYILYYIRKIFRMGKKRFPTYPGVFMAIAKFLPLSLFLEDNPHINEFLFTDSDVVLLKSMDNITTEDNEHVLTGMLQEHLLGDPNSDVYKTQKAICDYVGMNVDELKNVQDRNSNHTLSETYLFLNVNRELFDNIIYTAIDILNNFIPTYKEGSCHPLRVLDVQLLHMFITHMYGGYICTKELSSFRDVNFHNYTETDYPCSLFHLGDTVYDDSRFFLKYVKKIKHSWGELDKNDIEKQRQISKDIHPPHVLQYLDIIESYYDFLNQS